MTIEETVLTREGLARLQAELDELKQVKRRELAERIKLAISYGDLKENSEYHAAKNDQSFMETRILLLEKMIGSARLLEPDESVGSLVQVGSTVELYDIEYAEQLVYRIVGPAEANVSDSLISYESPLGKELLGKRAGETISVIAPMGIVEYELRAITMS